MGAAASVMVEFLEIPYTTIIIAAAVPAAMHYLGVLTIVHLERGGVTALLGAGIRIVLAQSFARTYFRNAINNDPFLIVCDTSEFHEGDQIAATGDAARSRCGTSGAAASWRRAPMPRSSCGSSTRAGSSPS